MYVYTLLPMDAYLQKSLPGKSPDYSHPACRFYPPEYVSPPPFPTPLEEIPRSFTASLVISHTSTSPDIIFGRRGFIFHPPRHEGPFHRRAVEKRSRPVISGTRDPFAWREENPSLVVTLG